MLFVYDRTALATPPSYAPMLGSDATYYDFSSAVTQPKMFSGANTAMALRGVQGGGTCEIRINGEWAEILCEEEGTPATEKPSAPSVITLMAGGSVRFDNVGMDRITSRVDHSRRGDLMVFDSVLDARRIVETENALLAKYSIVPSLPLRTVVFTGNSIVAGQGAVAGSTDFTTVALSLLNTPAAWKSPNFRAYNVGVGAQSTHTMLTADRVRVDRKLSEYHPANVVIIFEGTNDLYYGASASTALANLLAAYNLQRAACPGVRVGVGTVLPRSNSGTPGTFNADRATLNTALRNVLGSAVVDFAADATMGTDAASENPTYYPDKAHPSVAGHAILGQITADWINAAVP